MLMCKQKCSCYEEETKQIPLYDTYTGKLSGNYEKYKQGRCNGTKERDICDCGGNRLKCDFYSEVRNKAQSELYDKLDSYELKLMRSYIIKNDLIYDFLKFAEENA